MIVRTRLIPKGFSGCALWPFIFVLPEERANATLIGHELVHYREQAWITPLWVLLYLVSRRFRLAAEVRAYAWQIESGGISADEAARALLSYRLGISLKQAQTELALVSSDDPSASSFGQG